MTGNQIIRAYYTLAADILKDYLPYTPPMKLTAAKSYCGQIKRSKMGYEVYLSSWNLAVSDSLIDQEDIDEIIDTICHEFAHITFWEHGQDHTGMTDAYNKYVTAMLEVRRIERNLKQSA